MFAGIVDRIGVQIKEVAISGDAAGQAHLIDREFRQSSSTETNQMQQDCSKAILSHEPAPAERHEAKTFEPNRK